MVSVLLMVISGCATPKPKNPVQQPIEPTKVIVSLPPDKSISNDTDGAEPPPEGKVIEHKVKKGDTLSDLAEKYYGKSDKHRIIAKYNDLKKKSVLKVGQIILIPMTDGKEYPEKPNGKKDKPRKDHTKYIKHSIQPGETLSDVAKLYYDSYSKWRILAKFNGFRKNTQLKVGQIVKVPEIKGMAFPDKPKKRNATVSEPTNKDYKYTTHTVGKGDTLEIIAQKYYGEKSKWPIIPIIEKDNNLNPKRKLSIGQQIKIRTIDEQDL